MSLTHRPRVKGVTGPPLSVKPFLGHHKLITGHSIFIFLTQLGLRPSPYYFCGVNGFLLNLTSPFGKAVIRLHPLTRAHILTLMFPHLVKYHKITNRRARQFLLRPTPTHLHFIKRFHSHPLPTHPPTPSLHNLMRNRLKPSPTITIPSNPEPLHYRKTSFNLLRITVSAPTLLWKPQDTLYGSRFRSCFPREGVG